MAVVAKRGTIGVVVQAQAVGAPEDVCRLAHVQHQADDDTQRLRPVRHRAERRAAPVMGADERAHLAAFGLFGLPFFLLLLLS